MSAPTQPLAPAPSESTGDRDAARAQVEKLREALRAVMDRLSWRRTNEGPNHKNQRDDFDAIKLATGALSATPESASAELKQLRDENYRLKLLKLFGSDSLKSPHDLYEVVKRDELTALRIIAATAPATTAPVFSKDSPDKSTGNWCGLCGDAMKFNVPRLGPAGGFVHASTGQLLCATAAEPSKEAP